MVLLPYTSTKLLAKSVANSRIKYLHVQVRLCLVLFESLSGVNVKHYWKLHDGKKFKGTT